MKSRPDPYTFRLVKWLRRREEVSSSWLIDQERRERGQGIEQSCIDWDVMKTRFEREGAEG